MRQAAGTARAADVTIRQLCCSLGLTCDPGSVGRRLPTRVRAYALGVAGLGEDHLGEPWLGVLVVAVATVEQDDGVRALLEGARIA